MQNNIYTFKQRFSALYRYETRPNYFIGTIRDFLDRWIEDGFELFAKSLLHIALSILVIFLAPVIIIIKWVFAPVFWLYYSFSYKDEVFEFIEKRLKQKKVK